MSNETIISEEDTEALQSYLDGILDQALTKDTPVPETPKEEVKEEVQPAVLEDKTFKLDDMRLNDVFISDKKIEVTEEEKGVYLRALLHDSDVELTIPLVNKSFQVKLKTRNAWEQQLVYLAANKDLEERCIPNDGVNYMLQTQKYAAAIMLMSINSSPLPFLGDVNAVVEGTEYQKVEKAISILRDRRKIIDKMSMPKWSLCLNALRLFEGKLAIFASQVVNEDFWQPGG